MRRRCALDPRLALPVNAILDGNYRIERVVGAGGFAVTYEAEDLRLRKKVAVKEYYPIDYSDRDATMRILPKSEVHTTAFEWARSNFWRRTCSLAANTRASCGYCACSKQTRPPTW